MDSEAILIRVDGYGAVAHFSRAAKNTDCNFAAVGGKEFFHGIIVKNETDK